MAQAPKKRSTSRTATRIGYCVHSAADEYHRAGAEGESGEQNEILHHPVLLFQGSPSSSMESTSPVVTFVTACPGLVLWLA
jgi:hypothetical protein